MNLRCDLNINGGRRNLLLVSKQEETFDHIALKLGCALLFWDMAPALEVNPKHPALCECGFAPDLMALDDGGSVSLWCECGNVSLNKLEKVSRKFPAARLVIVKHSLRDAQRTRLAVDGELKKPEKAEIWAWNDQDFRRWSESIKEINYAFGEVRGKNINLVMNDGVFDVTLSAV